MLKGRSPNRKNVLQNCAEDVTRTRDPAIFRRIRGHPRGSDHIQSTPRTTGQCPSEGTKSEKIQPFGYIIGYTQSARHGTLMARLT